MRSVGRSAGMRAMSVPTSKNELLAAIETTFAKLQVDLDRVPVEVARDRTLDGHATATTMSPADLLAYLIGWNRQVLTWHERRAASLPDEFPAPGFAWNQLGLLAQHYYAEHEGESWYELRDEFTTGKERIVALVERCSDDALYGAPWYGRWTMGRMISLNTASPYANARRRLRAWLRTRAIPPVDDASASA